MKPSKPTKTHTAKPASSSSQNQGEVNSRIAIPMPNSNSRVALTALRLEGAVLACSGRGALGSAGRSVMVVRVLPRRFSCSPR